MNDLVNQTIQIDSELFERLQALAEPLVDNPTTVIRRLVDHWEQNPPDADIESPIRWCLLSRGERLPIGTKLRAVYNGHTYHASITSTGIFFESKTFNSPSAAAIHAKNLEGLRGSSANTNGWNFWEYYDEESSTWKPLRNLRRK